MDAWKIQSQRLKKKTAELIWSWIVDSTAEEELEYEEQNDDEDFKDNNDWNEKAIVSFMAFAVMCLIMIADLVTGWVGTELIINEYVYDSFVWVVLGQVLV